jgi:dTDP-4-amino-4,6-dideoxygalactose transaminase
MYKEWPLGKLPKELERPELDQIKKNGYNWDNPQDVVGIFENKVAEFSGAKFAIATDSCSSAIFLCLKYINKPQLLKIPEHTYISVPQQIIHAGYQVEFIKKEWSGVYQIEPLKLWDGAGRWTKGMYVGDNSLHVLSFQIKKRLPIGKGGMILCDDYDQYTWFKKMVYDGRNLKNFYDKDDIELLGYHMYMTPEDAARGILLMDMIEKINTDSHNNNSYPNLKGYKLFSDAHKFKQ